MDKDENPTVTTGPILKKGTIVSYKLVDDSHEQQATDAGCAGCGTSRNKFYFHIKKNENSLESLNLEVLAHWKKLPTKEVLLSKVEDQIEGKKVRLHKLQSRIDHDVYSEVPNDDH